MKSRSEILKTLIDNLKDDLAVTQRVLAITEAELAEALAAEAKEAE